MHTRLRYTRQQLTYTPAHGPYEYGCSICHRLGPGIDRIMHEESCPLADEHVAGLALIKLAVVEAEVDDGEIETEIHKS